MTLAACASSKAYPGPTLRRDQVGVVAPAIEEGFQRKWIAILQINGHDKLEEWRGGSIWRDGSQRVDLVPGEYEFKVEFKQSTTMPGLVTMAQDAAAAGAHGETNIVFPVTAEQTHRLHYDESSHVFSVSLFPGAARIHGVQPNKNAVPCVSNADRTMDFWCDLVP
jgi:hypothetical protein